VTTPPLQVDGQQKVSALMDLLRMYGNAANGGKAIIFVNTKARADEVNVAVNEFVPCDALHGDIAQAQREKVGARAADG
jgi:ATP-dependent RNA helicase DDX21